ncbi:MAG: hypothetical protein RL094_736 [Candidatus Parcubacteria bacterium]
MIKNKIAHLITLLAVLIFCFGYSSADAATMQINSNAATLSPGSIMTLSVVINSEGVAINNAEAKIIFPKDLLEVVSVSKGSSVFSLWVEEPSYSNLTGVITFNGGVPTPGFTGSNGTALSIVVKAKAPGKADLIFSDAAIRANDGLGTDVLTSKRGKTIAIDKKEEPAVPVIPTPTPAPTPAPSSALSTASLQITSPTHPSQELWYKDNNPLFRWKVPTGVDAVQTGIDNNTSGSPRVAYSPAINQKSVQDLKDGTWYFKVRARKDGVWGPTSTYIARIDSIVPQKNDVTFSYDEQKRVLNIDSDIVDETSGLDHYEIFVNDVLMKQVPSSEFVNGKYSIEVNTVGDNTVKLLAFDRAGNSVDALGTFNVSPMVNRLPEPVQPTTSSEQPLLITVGSFSIPAIYFAIITVCGLIILILGAFKLGRHYTKLRNKFITRNALVKGDTTKVLISLKKRLEKHLEILQRTRHTRTLSKEEKEIKEAIESDLDEVDKAIEKQKAE